MSKNNPSNVVVQDEFVEVDGVKTPKVYRYYAFISYSSKDRPAADQFHKWLSYYHIPSVIRGDIEEKRQLKYPKSLNPIFIDYADLGPAPLAPKLQEELENSKYLIVLCSPNSAKPECWVNQEVEYFISLGREERIIPYVIDGTPDSSDPSTEAFPPVLRKNAEYLFHPKDEEQRKKYELIREKLQTIGTLRAASIKDEGKRNARLKIVARMLEVAPDELIQRDKQRFRRRVATWSFGVVALLTIALTFAWITYDKHFRTHVDYYADYVECYGTPQGLYPLSEKQRSHRYESWRIETRDGLVRRLVHENSAKTPIPSGHTERLDRPMIATYDYIDRKLKICRYLDRNGRVVAQFNYSGENLDVVELKSVDSKGAEDNSLTLGSTSRIDVPLFDLKTSFKPKSAVRRLVHERDDQGRVKKQMFQSYEGNPARDADGIAGLKFELDDMGRVDEKTYLDSDGKVFATKIGVAKRRYAYDDAGNLYDSQYLDSDDQLIQNEQGWMRCINKFDKWGNYTEERTVDQNGNLLLRKEGFAKAVCRYDDRGNCLERSYYGIDGKPCVDRDGVATILRSYDDNGNTTVESYFGVDGEPCLYDGYARVAWQYDDKGNKIESAFFGVDGKPCVNHDGIAKVVKVYDDNGNITKQSYYGLDGKPCLHKDGEDEYAKIIRRYDDRGNCVELSYYGVDGKPCVDHDGVAKILRSYDENGNATVESYYGVDGKPCVDHDGCASIAFQYDDKGNIIESSFFGVDGKLSLVKIGEDEYAKIIRRCDDRGNCVELSYLGVDGKPCVVHNGYASIAFQYDDKGNIIESSFFGVDGKLCLHKDGYAREAFRFDDKGNLTEWAYFGIDGEPCLHKDGYAREAFRFDDKGNLTGWAYFGIDGEPCLHKNGYARFVLQYDDNGAIISTTYFDLEGRDVTENVMRSFSEPQEYEEKSSSSEQGESQADEDGIDEIFESVDESENEVE